jgi:dipeptidyl aminopeptidase/acylaminoacyl peptidase
MTSARARYVSCLVALSLVWISAGAAQQRWPVEPQEYGRWEQLAAQRTPLSPDGRWLVYGITRSNRLNELRVQPTAGGSETTIAFGEQPVFSDDSRWLGYLVGFSEEQEAKLRKERKPLHKSFGLLELSSGKITTVEGVESFSFSPNGSHVALRRYAPEAREAGAPTPPDTDDAVRNGTMLVLRELATGLDSTFGSVSELAWQDDGPLLAMAITVEGGVGNGVQLFDTATGRLRVLDSSSSTYTGVTWRKDSAALAVLRSSVSDTRQGTSHVALVWPDLARTPETVRSLDASTGGQLGPDLRVVRYRAPRWSDDGAYLFVGIARWPAKPVALPLDQQPRRVAATGENPDELPDVQVWHPADPVVMPRQKIDARRERERSMLAAWVVDEGRLVRIATAVGEEATPMPRSGRALVIDTNAFAMERSIGRVRGHAWMVDLRTGARTNLVEGIEDRYLQVSPGGRYVLYLKDDHYWTIDLTPNGAAQGGRALQPGRPINVTAAVNTSFIDRESDATVAQKPSFGVAGWSRDDRSILLYDKFDIWEVSPAGGSAARLTNGAAEQVRNRYVRLDPDEEFIDRTTPLLVSRFGLRSKKSGYAYVSAGSGGPAVNSGIWIDKRVDRLVKAKKADRVAYVVQGFDDSPDYFVADATLGQSTQVTNTNPFMAEYAWGRGTTINYRSRQGVELQGSLFYPAGYEPGKKYPMVVYMYEKLSDGLHQFSAPSERDYYNAAAFTSRGYFYLMPDIVFRPREPGVSVVDCVVPAVQQVAAMGVIDPGKVGIVGHSWGGFDSVYLATHTDVFAAAVAGAPITNLVSNYGNHHWTSGIAETDHIETGQQRMEVPIYEDLQAYIRNSAVYRAHVMKTPLMVMFGDNDGTVHWHQGVELYNIARRAGKNVVLLQYGGEDHGLRKKANQIDYHHRIFEWFDHYLKGTSAATWITDGERFIERERDLQQRKLPQPKPTSTTQTPQP